MGSSQVTDWEQPDLLPHPKEQTCLQRAALRALTWAQGPVLGNLDCAGGEIKAGSCHRTCAGTMRVVSTPAGLWGSVPLHRANAEQQIRGLLSLPRIWAAWWKSLFPFWREKQRLTGEAGRAPGD